MTPRSLFNIILKIVGLFILKDIIDAIVQIVLSVVELMQSFDGSGLWTLLISILVFALYYLVAHYLIFKTDFLIDKFKLDKNFTEENFPLNIHRSTVLSIAIIIIGGLLIADNVPLLCRVCYAYFRERSLSDTFSNKPDLSYIIMYAAKILVGLILVGNVQLLVNFIERKRRPSEIITEDN